MSKHRPRGRKASANAVHRQQGNEGRTSQKSGAKRPSTTRRRKPFYDPERREIRVGSTIVKCLRQQSDTVEIILLAFQEQKWPRSIDDPLPGKHGCDAKERLRTAVKNLNRRQREPMLRFRVRNQGAAVSWEFRDERH